jgi:adenine-specific DNA-methyltransferase
MHSYRTYLRDRFVSCRELLADTGAIFVQIGEDNLHRVRTVVDEVGSWPWSPLADLTRTAADENQNLEKPPENRPQQDAPD